MDLLPALVAIVVVPALNGQALSPRYLGFVTGGGERMRINSSGDLLLGTTTNIAAFGVPMFVRSP